MPDDTATTQGFTPDVKWEPFIDRGRAGYKITRLSDGAVTYLYFNPSTEGEGEPDVFVYSGPFNDPIADEPLKYFTPDFAPQIETAWCPLYAPIDGMNGLYLAGAYNALKFAASVGHNGAPPIAVLQIEIDPDTYDARVIRVVQRQEFPNG